jgi:hypothetical protein
MPLNKKRDVAVIVATVTTIGVIGAAFFTSLGSTVAAYITSLHPDKGSEKATVIVQVVPPAQAKEVPKLNPETGAKEIETLRDISMWDLRGWKAVPSGENNPRYSPVNYVNYLHVRKLQPATTYRAHYSTDGSLIDLRCITHPFNLFQKTGGDDSHPNEGKKTYEMDVDVSDVSVGNEFLIVIEATFWNNFQGNGPQEASTYTDEDMNQMDELAMFILMPESKPFRNPQRWERLTTQVNRVPYNGNERFYTDKDGRFVYWSIQKRKPNHHYQLSWEW